MYLSLFEQIIGKPVIPVGLLPPLKSNKAQKQTRDENWTQIFKCLDYEKPRSVLFVGFGSECKLNKEEIHEIAHGLEKSELPFLWALRKPTWAIEDLDSVQIEFTDRTLERGRVMEPKPKQFCLCILIWILMNWVFWVCSLHQNQIKDDEIWFSNSTNGDEPSSPASTSLHLRRLLFFFFFFFFFFLLLLYSSSSLSVASLVC
ncbi:putative UDP-rhamnose:rhamnosyltransferase 1 [Camellia lanceoleosa]|uniref:UDP-rhamnose:rhamnosyltransferase 1 n=1 Tax=Camellia lanceoleosa TaxID=1840588 RepID=A0ACC0IIY1_9ERIC|nr:putative UDP-rhamnose:rhamnosyltransferase 1 [Camellia lanceoleosa]